MPASSYRVFMDDDAISQGQLDRLETISVEQEVDVAWHARIEIPACMDDKGHWRREDLRFVRSFARLRVEVKLGEGRFTALIDGPVVGYETRLSFEPGQSTIIAVVQDDSVYLNRREQVELFEDVLDHEAARRLYQNTRQIRETDIETTPRPPGDLPPMVVQRGTAMQLLRQLAQRQGMHAYVLPGERPGRSIGVFRSFPDAARQRERLPAMILFGQDRNIRSFDATHDAQGPATVMSSSFRLTDQGNLEGTASFRDRRLLGDEASLRPDADEARLLLPPGYGDTVDLRQATAGVATESGFAFQASGSVIEGIYDGVLRPYRLVDIRIGDTPLSGTYLIARVAHRLSRSNYTQDFTVRRDAQSRLSGGPSQLIGSIL